MDRRAPVDLGDAATPMPDAEMAAEPALEFFDREVLPLLDGQCSACHGAGRTAPAFLAPDPDVYTTVTSWPALVRRSDPGSSRILTKGAHAGPAWNSTQAATIQEWLRLESEQSDAEDVVEHRTDSVAPVAGINVLDLGAMGLPGTAITFIAETTAAGLYVSNLLVSAGPMGARLVHPVVVTWRAGSAIADPVDRFAGLEVDVAPSSSAPVGGGSLSLVDFVEGNL